MKKLTSSLIILLVLSAFIVIADPNGATVNIGNSERKADDPAGTVQGVIGNLTRVNVTGNIRTAKWAGFYGRITAGLLLSDATSNVFYEWQFQNVTNATVYATNGTIANWANLIPANESLMPSNLRVDTADNFNNTFTTTDTFSGDGMTIANAPYTTTWQSGSQGQLKTYALADGDDSDIVFAGKALYNVTGFKGGANSVDYQILVPGFSSGASYYFYLSLS